MIIVKLRYGDFNFRALWILRCGHFKNGVYLKIFLLILLILILLAASFPKIIHLYND